MLGELKDTVYVTTARTRQEGSRERTDQSKFFPALPSLLRILCASPANFTLFGLIYYQVLLIKSFVHYLFNYDAGKRPIYSSSDTLFLVQTYVLLSLSYFSKVFVRYLFMMLSNEASKP